MVDLVQVMCLEVLRYSCYINSYCEAQTRSSKIELRYGF